MDIKLSTLRGKYLLREKRDFFDAVKRGDLELDLTVKTGFVYSDFSNCCEVVAAPTDGKYRVGETVWVHHFVFDDRVRDDQFGEPLYATREENIFFAGESPLECDDEDFVVFQYLKTKEKEINGIVAQIATEDDRRGRVVAGALPKDAVITYRLNKELEFFHNEEQYLLIEKDWITSVNGKPYGDWYETDDFENTYFDCGFIHLKGQIGAKTQLKMQLAGTKKEKIVKLNNPSLPLHGKTVIATETWQDKYVCHNYKLSGDAKHRGVIAEIDSNAFVMS